MIDRARILAAYPEHERIAQGCKPFLTPEDVKAAMASCAAAEGVSAADVQRVLQEKFAGLAG